MSKIDEVKAPTITKILTLDEGISYSQFAVSGIDSSLNKLQHILDEYVYLKKQAQKQEKLLELYKELSKIKGELYYYDEQYRTITINNKSEAVIEYLEEKIKELEDEERDDYHVHVGASL